MILDEMQNVFHPGDDATKYPEKLLDRFLGQRDYVIQKYKANAIVGYIFASVKADEPCLSKWGWPTQNYFMSILTATQRHHAGGFHPSYRPSLQFLTHFSHLIWARDIKAVPIDEVERSVALAAPEKLWWKGLVYRRETARGQDWILHLVRIPPTEKWDIDWVDRAFSAYGSDTDRRYRLCEVIDRAGVSPLSLRGGTAGGSTYACRETEWGGGYVRDPAIQVSHDGCRAARERLTRGCLYLVSFRTLNMFRTSGAQPSHSHYAVSSRPSTSNGPRCSRSTLGLGRWTRKKRAAGQWSAALFLSSREFRAARDRAVTPHHQGHAIVGSYVSQVSSSGSSSVGSTPQGCVSSANGPGLTISP